MTISKFILFFLFVALYSCGQRQKKHIVNVEAIKLSNKIVRLSMHTDNLDSCRKALEYLDSSTVIDSNFFFSYYNKLMFLCPLKNFDKAIIAINNCIRISPNSNDLYLTGGILYEKIGDTISSHKYFQKSLDLINPVLDTMKARDINYEMLRTNKAINFIMLGQNKIGEDLLKSIYDAQNESEQKEMTLLYMNKSKKELVELMINTK